MITTQKIHAVLRKAGFEPSRSASGGRAILIPNQTHGYRVTEYQNKFHLIYLSPYRNHVVDQESEKMRSIRAALAEAGIACDHNENGIWIKKDQALAPVRSPGRA